MAHSTHGLTLPESRCFIEESAVLYQLCHCSSKRLERQSGERLPESRCFVEESGLLYHLGHFSFKCLEEKWHNWYSMPLSSTGSIP